MGRETAGRNADGGCGWEQVLERVTNTDKQTYHPPVPSVFPIKLGIDVKFTRKGSPTSKGAGIVRSFQPKNVFLRLAS